ncbi:MAG: hypothetical protein Kow00121_35620 [Elainellaceae cyanobacterium]
MPDLVDLTSNMTVSPIVELAISSVTYELFQPYGTLIEVAESGKPFGSNEAQLELSQGIPRFYIMNLNWRSLTFHKITRHLQVTQCLAAVGGKPWLFAVAPPEHLDNPAAQPNPSEIRAFSIPGDCAIHLHCGTWHAGPFFFEPQASFFNLELADTNQVDHHTCDLEQAYGLKMRLKV